MRFDAAIIILMASVVALIIERIFYYKSKYGNKKVPENNPGPGNATVCIEHGNKLTELNTKMEELDKDLERLRSENREDHKLIFDKFNKVGKK